MDATTDLKMLGRIPVSSDHPAGTDARYDPLFEEAQGLIDKLSVATAGVQQIDWNRMLTVCFMILSEKSKDILVVGYLSLALSKIHGLAGVAAGAHILRDVIEAYWEDLFPPKERSRGRINALNWWVERMSGFLETDDEPPAPRELMEELQEDLAAMDEILSGKEGEYPTLRPMMSILSRLPVLDPPPPDSAPAGDAAGRETGKSAPQDVAAPTGREANPGTQPAPTQKDPAPNPPPDADGGPTAAPSQADIPAPANPTVMLASAQDILSRAAGPLLSAEPTNPAGYRLTRLAAWLTVGMPPHDEDFKTRIPGPDKMIKVSLEQLAASGKHLQAVQACEGRVTEFLFWLDITRLTATSLQALGSDFAAALLAVETETRYFLKRLPGIEQLAFSDATPFADQETRGWLSRLAISQEQPPCPSGAEQDAKGEAGDSDMSKKVEEARNLAATGQTVKAVTMLQDRIAKAGSGRSRLLWRIILVELLTAVGRPEIAASIMSQIINDVDTFRVEEFDPELALRGLRSALSALAASRAPESAAQAAQILARVTRLNPAEGLRLSGVKEGFGKL